MGGGSEISFSLRHFDRWGIGHRKESDVGAEGLLWLMIEILHYLKDPKTMGHMKHSLVGALQDFYHRP